MNFTQSSIPQFPEALVVELPAKHLVGLKVRTSMKTASVDCVALWEGFAPWMWRVYGLESYGYACPYFGLSMDADMQSGQFTYWATIEVQSNFADPVHWPDGFEAVTLAAGPYVGTGVASLSKLTEAYTHLYGPWVHSQHDHELDFSGICFELYDECFLKDGSLEVFAPLRA